MAKQNIPRMILAGLLVLMIALVLFYRQSTLQSIREVSQVHNEELSRTFLHSLWPGFQPIVENGREISTEDYRRDPSLAAISDHVREMVKDTPILKIKLYTLNANVLYSTDPSEIGVNESANPRLRRSLVGETLTIFRIHPDFKLFDRTVKGRELLVSYIPVFDDVGGNEQRAVFELYYDMTPILNHMRLVTGFIFATVLTVAFFASSAYFVILRSGAATVDDRILIFAPKQISSSNLSIVVLALLIATLIFVFDISLPLGVAAGVPYVALVLVGLWHPDRRAIIILAIAGTVLTTIGYYFSSPAGIEWMILTNRMLAIFVIWTTAGLSYWVKAQTDKKMSELAKIPEQNPAPVFRVSGDGTLIYSNTAGTDFAPFQDCEIGQPVPGNWQQIFAETLATGQVREEDCQHGARHYQMTIKPIQQGGYVNIYVNEITKQKQIEGRLRAAINEAELASRAKSEFLASTGHELRTPLNAIIGFSSAMSEEVFGPVGHEKYRDYVTNIQDSGERLLDVINDILDLSAIEMGKLELNLELVDPSEISGVAIEMVTQRAQTANINLSYEIDPGLPEFSADPVRVKHILISLLDNAIKFTPEDGKVELRVKREGNGLAFAISDNGIGIGADDMDKALSNFGQVDGRLSRKFEGSGLGLPLAKNIVELHGGSLAIDSELGTGTTVTLRFSIGLTITDANSVIESSKVGED